MVMTRYAKAIVIPNNETLIPDPKIAMFWSLTLKKLTLIHAAFALDPDPEVSDPDRMACNPNPKLVIPDPVYYVTTLHYTHLCKSHNAPGLFWLLSDMSLVQDDT